MTTPVKELAAPFTPLMSLMIIHNAFALSIEKINIKKI